MPDYIESCLDVSAKAGVVEQFPTACAFNHQGTYLAIGCNTGRVLVIDNDTQGLARSLMGHCRPVSCMRYEMPTAARLRVGYPDVAAVGSVGPQTATCC